MLYDEDDNSIDSNLKLKLADMLLIVCAKSKTLALLRIASLLAGFLL